METLHPSVEPPPHSGEARAGTGHTLAVVLLAVGLTWNTGNIGPVTEALADGFHVSLTAIGLVSGTMLFAGTIVAGLAGNAIAHRIGAARGAQVACLICVVANLGMAFTPWFAGFYPARFVAGIGNGLALTLGPVIARALGGVRLVGYFGAGVMLGVAGALAIGSVLEDAGVDWRWAFGVSAAVAAVPIFLLPGSAEVDTPGRHEPHRLGQLLRSPALWRLAMLLAATLGIPMVIGAWLIHYLSVDGRIATTVAGLLSFLLFGVSAFARIAGGRLGTRLPAALLMGLPPLLAAGGLATVALDERTLVAAVAMVAMGIGFSLPYAATVEQVALRFPDTKVEALAVCTVWIAIVPLVAVPVVGWALSHDHGKVAWLILAAMIVLAGLINLPRGTSTPRASASRTANPLPQHPLRS